MKNWIGFLAVVLLCFSFGSAAGQSPGDTCLARGDLNGDGNPLTVSDLSEMVRVVAREIPAPANLYEVDLNGSCRVDSTDLRLFQDFFIYGFGALPGYPRAVCCNPTLDTFCLARGDINGDGSPLTAADITALVRIMVGEVPPPANLYEADLNGDCVVNQADLNLLQNFPIYGPGSLPGYPVPTCCNPTLVPIACAAAKGDMNADGSVTSSDVVLMLNCAFLGMGNCALCFADLNCDGALTSADVVQELNYSFLGIPPSGCP